jgi:hypothetical protein
VASSCECGNEPSNSIKCWKLLLVEDLLASKNGLCSMESVNWSVKTNILNVKKKACNIRISGIFARSSNHYCHGDATMRSLRNVDVHMSMLTM